MAFFELWLLAVNVLVFFVFFYDKLAAMRGGWRLSENALLLWLAVAPLGAWLAIFVIRHKSSKARFLFKALFATLLSGLLHYEMWRLLQPDTFFS